ncbi:MAG: hypothetical protein AAF609_05435 [Cyanobacteria bacterium P01_C01_bin.120]
MANLNPKQTPEFLAKQKSPVLVEGIPLAKKPLPVRFDRESDELLRQRSDRQALIRRYVREGLRRDGYL